jgi:hypothetical protein
MSQPDPPVPSPQGSQYSAARSHAGSVPAPSTPVDQLLGHPQSLVSPYILLVSPSPTAPPSPLPPVDSPVPSQHPQDELSPIRMATPADAPGPSVSPGYHAPTPVQALIGMSITSPVMSQDEDAFDSYSQVSQHSSPLIKRSHLLPYITILNFCVG